MNGLNGHVMDVVPNTHTLSFTMKEIASLSLSGRVKMKCNQNCQDREKRRRRRKAKEIFCFSYWFSFREGVITIESKMRVNNGEMWNVTYSIRTENGKFKGSFFGLF